MKTKDAEVRVQNLCQPVGGSAPPGDDRENKWERLPLKILHRILIQIRKQKVDSRVRLDFGPPTTQCPVYVRNTSLQQRHWGISLRRFFQQSDRTLKHDLRMAHYDPHKRPNQPATLGITISAA